MWVCVCDNWKVMLIIKVGGYGMICDEFEFDVLVDEVVFFFQLKFGNFIEKICYKVKVVKYVWEIDVYFGVLEGLIVVEVEMKFEKESFEIFEWIGLELIGNLVYFNQVLVFLGLLVDIYVEV